jgi:hypothetical protein
LTLLIQWARRWGACWRNHFRRAVRYSSTVEAIAMYAEIAMPKRVEIAEEMLGEP